MSRVTKCTHLEASPGDDDDDDDDDDKVVIVLKLVKVMVTMAI